MPQNSIYLDYNVAGADRKRLVEAISDYTGSDAKYLCAPSFAYEVGGYHIDKAGRVSFDGTITREEIEKLIAVLKNVGFIARNEDIASNIGDGSDLTDEDELAPEGLTIVLPLDGFDTEAQARLSRLVSSKAGLIQKALGADRLTIQTENDSISFPWWDKLPDPYETKAYIAFLTALYKMAREAKRVVATEKDVESEKYTFRAFLLRLGFIGSDSKEIRKQLLKNLSGSAAFPNQEKAEAFSAEQREKHSAAKEAVL